VAKFSPKIEKAMAGLVDGLFKKVE